MKVAFRADASRDIGSGHIVRDLTLADELRLAGAEILFVCCDQPGAMTNVIRQRGYEVACLTPRRHRNGSATSGSTWSDAEQHDDAEETRHALDRLGTAPCDWIVVDHYGLDRHWETQIRLSATSVMVIDDLANRPHDCDLLLDQNLVEGFGSRYRKLMPEHARALLGPAYVLLQPEFLVARERRRLPHDDGGIVVAYFGASDLPNLTSLAIRAFAALRDPKLAMVAVVGHSNPHRQEIDSLAAADERVSIYEPLPSLAELLAQADLCVGAGGATTWERLCLKVPSIVYSIADNQTQISQYLGELGEILYLGNASGADLGSLRDAMSAVLSGAWRPSLSLAAPIDGLGAQRVASELLRNS